jgi:hypothetical protein
MTNVHTLSKTHDRDVRSAAYAWLRSPDLPSRVRSGELPMYIQVDHRHYLVEFKGGTIARVSELTPTLPEKKSLSERPAPSTIALWLIDASAPKQLREALLGDLDERFQRDADRFGAITARRRHLFAALRSVGPLLSCRIAQTKTFTLLRRTVQRIYRS